MEKIILKAEVRTASGKRVAKDLRANGFVPGNVYKGGHSATSLQVSAANLAEVLRTKAGENVIITLKLSGAVPSDSRETKEKTVVIKELQREPIKNRILHVDFNEISLTETLKVNVPLLSRGEPVGVKVDGGILEHVIRELQVECLPTAIPEKVEIDVSSLKINETIHVKDIVPPEGVKILNDGELIAMIVKAPKVEAPKEEIAAEGALEPELIRKKKEEEAEGGEEKGKEGKIGVEKGKEDKGKEEKGKEGAKPAAGGKEEKK
ncbi:MAG: 50S ribosomal protein L25 [Candidatus Omnitrophota bacterium]|nr:50S ribosomal protein L25 [Candidatus Omnitrophota bacterium]